jgi:hypothetical protein
MLMVKVEIWPGGAEHRKREIGRMTIGNISDLEDLSDYEVWGIAKSNHLSGQRELEYDGVVQGHDRRQGVWELVVKAIAEMLKKGGE